MNNGFFSKYGDRLLFALALAVLATGIIRAGLGTRPGEEPPVPPSIVFTHWWENTLGYNTLLELKEEFESLHDNIIIIFETRPYEELRQELFDHLATSDHGDIFALDVLWVPELLSMGIIEETPYAPARAPLLSFINVLYYNVDILREAGFIRPPRSRSEFLNYARTVANKENRWALSINENSSRGIYDDIFPWIWSAGIELVRDGRPAVNTRQVIDSLAFLATLKNEGLISPAALPDALSAFDESPKLEDFVSGRAAFIIASSGSIGRVRERMGDGAFDITLVPAPDNYAGIFFHSASAWTVGVNAASAYKEEARLFADFITQKAPFLAERAGGVNAGLFPGINAPQNGLEPIYAKLWDISIAAESASELSGLPWATLESIFREELNALFAEESTSAQTAAAIQRRWEALSGDE